MKTETPISEPALTEEQMIDEKKRYIEVWPVTFDGEVEYQIILDKKNSIFGVDKWRNTAEKIGRIRDMGYLHQFGEYQDCISKGALIELISKGWLANGLPDVIEIFNQRIRQHEVHSKALSGTIDDKQKEIDRLRFIVADYEKNQIPES